MLTILSDPRKWVAYSHTRSNKPETKISHEVPVVAALSLFL